MSYIRSGSNPESMYIWGDSRGHVTLCHKVKPPLASEPDMFVVPIHIFEGVCLRWEKAFDEKASYRGARAELVHVLTRTGESVPKDLTVQEYMKVESENLVRFSYEEHFVHMWTVTWEYIVAGVVARKKWVPK